MQNNNRKVFETIISRTKIYLAIILVLLVVICFERPEFIIPSILLYIAIVGYTYYANNKRKSEISETLQDLTLTVDSAAKTSLINSPFPLIILETDGSVIWRSSKFISEFANIDINTYINDLSIDIIDEIKNKEKIVDKDKKDIVRKLKIGDKIYKIMGRYVNVKNKDKDKKAKKEYMIILYFIDDTENVKLQKEYKDSKTCVSIIMIDNYEETLQRVEAEEKAQITAEIDKTIYEWADLTNGVLIKSDRDRYIYL